MKVIEDILREVDLEVLRKAPHAQRKYNKITDSLRSRFLTKIFQENKSIKKAAEELNINYSSAKTILTMYRKKVKASNSANDLLALEQKQALYDNQMSLETHDLKVLPPKDQIKQSFLSTASNLSELKDEEDSFEDNHNHGHHEESPKLSSFVKINKNVVIVPPPKQEMELSQQQQTSLPKKQELPSKVSPTILEKIQQQIQAQQQQQQQEQLYNTLQQLLVLQNFVAAQQLQQSPQQNQLSSLLQQQNYLLNNPFNLQNWI